ncbi:MAG: DUF3833 domain-containing protein [Rickettsiaceae bacterium]|jgi:hypothetical protein|nr:DUF3833 domain-containing protein [Rickettsiaceae bacterium]
MKKIQIMIMSIICFFIPGCSNNSIDYYSNKKNKIDLRAFFQGEIEGWGALFDYRGRQTRSFYVTLKGTWDKNRGVLEEWFIFDNGEKTERKWEINFSNDLMFIGTAKDIVGEAKGKQNGNAVNLNYVLNIPYNNSTINLNMDDWMFLVEDNIILNRTSMKKFGFKVGEIVLFMKKK